jgi:hypothetical protein
MSGSLPLVPGVIAPPAFSLHRQNVYTHRMCRVQSSNVALRQKDERVAAAGAWRHRTACVQPA